MKLPQLVDDMSFAEYLADPMPEPSLTSSLCKAMLSTAPRRVWAENFDPEDQDEDEAKFDLGTACHALVTGAGNKIAVIDAKDYRGGDAKAQRDAARKAGMTPILKTKWPAVQLMAERAWEEFSSNPDIGPLLSSSKREATIMWQEAGIMCRCRPDFYHEVTNTMIHYKTTATSIQPSGLARFAASQGWDLIAAHYDAGARYLTGRPSQQFFAVQEVDKPHLGVVVKLDPTFMETAHMRRDEAVNRWAKCVRSDIWPGFPRNTILLECPEWHERNMTAEKDAEENARKGGTDLLAMARQWQAPEGWRKADGSVTE
jgi:hypothetical protein